MSEATSPWRSASCEGERCSICGAPAQAKVGEEILHDDPFHERHNLTAYICRGHFKQIMGERGVESVESMRAARIRADASLPP